MLFHGGYIRIQQVDAIEWIVFNDVGGLGFNPSGCKAEVSCGFRGLVEGLGYVRSVHGDERSPSQRWG